MWSIAKKVYSGVRAHSLSYLITVGWNEMINPRRAVTRGARATVIAIVDRIRPPRDDLDGAKDHRLQFVYDLGAAPVTFDFASYLAAAEVERRRRGFTDIEVIFVPGDRDGLRREHPDYEQVVSPASRQWRIRHILIPILALLPSVRSYVICRDRNHAAQLISNRPGTLYPDDYRSYLIRQPSKRQIHDLARDANIFPMFRATTRARDLVAQFLTRHAAGRKTIVITIRNYDYDQKRNSRLENWLRFADRLDRERFVPIFLPDSETHVEGMVQEFGGHIVCEAASLDLEIRMALYEAAWLNMAVMHGPMELCWLNENARYLIFFEIGTTAVSSVVMLEEAGHPAHTPLRFAKPYQRIVWEGDHLHVLEREFSAFAPLLDQAPRDALVASAASDTSA